MIWDEIKTNLTQDFDFEKPIRKIVMGRKEKKSDDEIIDFGTVSVYAAGWNRSKERYYWVISLEIEGNEYLLTKDGNITPLRKKEDIVPEYREATYFESSMKALDSFYKYFKNKDNKKHGKRTFRNRKFKQRGVFSSKKRRGGRKKNAA